MVKRMTRTRETTGQKTVPIFRHLMLASIWLIALSLLQACNNSPTPSEASPIGPPSKAVAASSPAATEPAEESFTGPIVVENQIDVSAQREGMVTDILADVGQIVHKGQLLAKLDDRQLTAQRDAAEAKLHSCEADLKDWQAETRVASSDLKRAEEMRAAGINTQEALDHDRYKYEGSQFAVDKAQQDLNNAKATLREFELELQKTRIEAPFEGVVARRYVRAGQKVASGDRLFWVSAVEPLLVKFTLPERLMGKVKKGDLVYVSSVAAPQSEHSAKLVQISPVVDPASDSIDVEAKLEGKPADLHPGMTAHIRLASSSQKPQ
jgi:RND family efflux transporter MFP subunit